MAKPKSMLEEKEWEKSMGHGEHSQSTGLTESLVEKTEDKPVSKPLDDRINQAD